MSCMDDGSFEVYRSRAIQLSDAMKLCGDDLHTYASAVALLAIHSAISYSDVLHIWLTGNRPDGADHKQAVLSAKRACRKAGIESAPISHLERLLSAKTEVSYGNRMIVAEYAQTLSIAAERFQAWVERNLAGKRINQ
jgi:hypothetical protein